MKTIVTNNEKLKGYRFPKEIISGVEHRQHKGINNRAENSHQPTRQQEKQMRKFKSQKQAQRFFKVRAELCVNALYTPELYSVKTIPLSLESFQRIM